MLTALLLLQMSVFQGWVDDAADRLGLPPQTIVEDPEMGSLAGTYGDGIIYVNPLLFAWNPNSKALRHLAYHEVCHVYLRHAEKAAAVRLKSRNLLGELQATHQAEADDCAMTYVLNYKRTTKFWKAWMDFTNKHPFDWGNRRRSPTRRVSGR